MTAPARVIVLATSNRGKLREVRAVLADLPAALKGLDDFPPIPKPEETGETFDANASLKALYYAKQTGCWALADDSGLEVDALGGAPGVRSSRYAGREGDDAANNARLVAALAGMPGERRTARFRCAVALADTERVLARASGEIEGRIIDLPRGQNGFGYDPHFLVPELGVTTAELPPEQKNAISHRGRALRAIRPALERLLRTAASST